MVMDGVEIFSFDQPNTKGRPSEDYCWIGIKNAISFAVADGVSRTRNVLHEGEVITSQAAARIFCHQAAFGFARRKTIHEAFALANAAIGEMNKGVGITPETVDYLDCDYLCCTAIAGVLMESPDRLVYGCIGDCGLLVYDADYMPVFLTENNVAILEEFRDCRRFSDKNERRIFWRKELRNRCARFMTYGALTGEPSALAQIKYGYVDLQPGDTVVLFSDGIYPFIFYEMFRVTVTNLLMSSVTEAEIREIMRAYMQGATMRLRDQGAKNLDDDKTMIAFRLK